MTHWIEIPPEEVSGDRPLSSVNLHSLRSNILTLSERRYLTNLVPSSLDPFFATCTDASVWYPFDGILPPIPIYPALDGSPRPITIHFSAKVGGGTASIRIYLLPTSESGAFDSDAGYLDFAASQYYGDTETSSTTYEDLSVTIYPIDLGAFPGLLSRPSLPCLFPFIISKNGTAGKTTSISSLAFYEGGPE